MDPSSSSAESLLLPHEMDGRTRINGEVVEDVVAGDSSSSSSVDGIVAEGGSSMGGTGDWEDGGSGSGEEHSGSKGFAVVSASLLVCGSGDRSGWNDTGGRVGKTVSTAVLMEEMQDSIRKPLAILSEPPEASTTTTSTEDSAPSDNGNDDEGDEDDDDAGSGLVSGAGGEGGVGRTSSSPSLTGELVLLLHVSSSSSSSSSPSSSSSSIT